MNMENLGTDWRTIRTQPLKLSLFIAVILLGHHVHAARALPNILWLTSEDNSPLLGCYGDEFATTPNLDRLAGEGFLYTHAYGNAPVCAPARNTIASGVYASSSGHTNMRSNYSRSDKIRFHAELLRELGYYCTNNSKTDYNTNVDKEIWDECSNKAHYNNRPAGKPFFAIFNTFITHESRLHKSIPTGELKHDPEKVPIPPYHPRTEEMKHDWAQYYDKVEEMDAQIGKWLDELEEAGLADDTIVFYYADHGGVLGRSKRYVYETGTRVPLIVRIPEKYRDLWPAGEINSKIDRLVSFVDLAPTLLSLAGAEIPGYMQGEAFLGGKKTKDPEYVYMFRDRMDEWYDMSRAVRDRRYRYIRNYMPYRIYGLPIQYLWKAPSMQSWERAYRNGECNETQSIFWNTKPVEELYDTEHDPWEIDNLAGDPAHADILQRMRSALHDWLVRTVDTGFIPEADRSMRVGDRAIYDYFHSKDFSIELIVEAADLATMGKAENAQKMVLLLSSDDTAIQYWGATGLLLLGEDARPYLKDLKKASRADAYDVAIVACEALYGLGEKEEARQGYLRALESSQEFARTHAMNSIYCVGDDSPEIRNKVIEILESLSSRGGKRYDHRAADLLCKKWGMDLQDLAGSD